MIRGRRLIRALTAAAALAVLAVPEIPAGAAPKPKDPEVGFLYTIREARASAYRASLRKEVIEGARRARPCDPATDPYQCDTTQYEHQPNCPAPIAVGPEGTAPEPRAVPGARPSEGGAGNRAGAGSEPPTASPITLNRFFTQARLGRAGQLVEAAGLSSDSYVDLSGRQEPTMHTESDILPGLPRYEERCLVRTSTQSFRHFLSQTGAAPETYHLAECRKDDCPLDRLTFSAQNVMARTIIHLKEEKGKVVGRIQATFQDAAWGNEAFAADSIDTLMTFESDGTAEGLKWSIGTTAQGTRLGGAPVTLPIGRMVGSPDLQAGIAAPYVEAAEDGSILRIVAPGVIVASREQTAWFGSAEVDATFGLTGPGGAPLKSSAGGGKSGGKGSGAAPASGDGSGSGAPAATTGGAAPAPSAGSPSGDFGATVGGETTTAAAAPAPSTEAVSVTRFQTRLPFVLILLAGLLAGLWIVIRWMGQFPAGRALYTYPPFTLLDRLYRTFAKS